MQPMAAQMGFTHNLGNFEVEQVSFVEETPGPGDGYDGGGHLKLSLASTSQLALGYPTHWIGVASDYCPLEDDHNLLAFGYFGDGQSFWDHSEPKPAERSADGLFRYEIYVVRSYPPLGKTRDDFGGPQKGPYAQNEYDIVDDQKDLCLQFFGGDHYHVFARSATIRVEYKAIHKAAIAAQMAKHP